MNRIPLYQAFMTHAKVKDIAEAAGVSLSTVNRLKRDAKFQDELMAYRKQVLRGTTDKLIGLYETNIIRLDEIASDADINPAIRIQAINSMFRQTNDWIERIDILDRIERIEKAIDKK